LEEGGGDLDGGRKKKKPTEGSDLFKLMKLIKERNMDPAIIFSFSKKEVEGYAMAMSKMDLTSQEEKEKIEHVYTNAMLCLSDEDR
jgi:ATP-dependent RNA helicase DOB1